MKSSSKSRTLDIYIIQTIATKRTILCSSNNLSQRWTLNGILSPSTEQTTTVHISLDKSISIYFITPTQSQRVFHTPNGTNSKVAIFGCSDIRTSAQLTTWHSLCAAVDTGRTLLEPHCVYLSKSASNHKFWYPATTSTEIINWLTILQFGISSNIYYM